MEYIKLKQALHVLDVVMSDDSIKHKGKAIRKRLKELPGEDVEKVVHGEWIQGQSISQECSCCGFEIDDDVPMKCIVVTVIKSPSFVLSVVQKWSHKNYLSIQTNLEKWLKN